jgi:hypothetical protein
VATIKSTTKVISEFNIALLCPCLAAGICVSP